MKNRFLIHTALLFFVANSVVAQISGKVLQKKNKQPVAFASVLLEGTQKYATTDEKGFFKISTQKTKGTLKIVAMGFKNQFYKIKNHKNILIYLVEDTENLKSVMVHGKSDAQKKREEPIKVAVLDLEKIQAQPTPLPQLINQESGVKVRQASGVGSPVLVNINGLQGRAIRFFKDGIPMEYLGRAFDLSSVPTDQLAALEIYKGMLPAALGTDALGGAINFKTKIPDKNNLQLSAMVGSFGTYQGNLNAYHKIGKYFFVNPTVYYVSAENDYEITAPVLNEITRNNVDKKVKRFHDGIKSYYVSSKIGILNYFLADELALELGFYNRDKEIQHRLAFSNPAGEANETEESKIAALRYKKELHKFKVDLFAAYSAITNKAIDTSKNIWSWEGKITGKKGNQGELVDGGLLMTLNYKNYVGRAMASYEFYPEHSFVMSHNYVKTTRTGSAMPGPRTWQEGLDPLESPTNYQKNVTGAGYIASFWGGKIKNELTAKYYKLDATAQSLWEYGQNEKGTNSFFGYGNSLKFSFGEDIYFRFSYERTLRIPDSEEYFGDGMFVLANGQLNPEKSHNFNLGFYTFLDPKKTLWLDVNGFYRDTEDLILLEGLGLRYAQYRNMDNGKVKGIEGSLKWMFLQGYNFNFALTYQDLRRFTPSEENALYDSRVPYTPYFFGNVSFSKTFSNLFSNQKYFKSDFNLYTNYAYTEQYMLNAVAKVNEPALFEQIDEDSSLFIPTQNILDLGLTMTFQNIPMSLNVEFGNVLNQKLYDQFRVQKPGFNTRFKIIYTIK